MLYALCPMPYALCPVQGFQLGGFFAALAQGALGGVPLFGAGGPRSYEAYHLKRSKPVSRA